MSFLEEMFKENEKRIKKVTEKVSGFENGIAISGLTYGFVECTLSEAQAFSTTTLEYRHISDARKSGEGVGLGTGLPAFYDVSSASWVDLMGNVITT